MIYTFKQEIGSKNLPELLNFIQKEGSGIFIFAEGFLGVDDNLRRMTELTKDGKISIISGIMNDPNKVKAYLFAYKFIR